MVDTKAPATYMHLHLKLKKLQVGDIYLLYTYIWYNFWTVCCLCLGWSNGITSSTPCDIESQIRLTLRKCWFALLLPIHPKQALPKKNYCLFENLFFAFFFSNSVNKPFFKIIKSCKVTETVVICILTLYTAFVGTAMCLHIFKNMKKKWNKDFLKYGIYLNYLCWTPPPPLNGYFALKVAFHQRLCIACQKKSNIIHTEIQYYLEKINC